MATKKAAAGAGAPTTKTTTTSAAPSAPALAAGAEAARLSDDANRGANWKRWGPYVSERQWGTVREDYSADGSCWTYFSHDQSRSRAYRWGEDGILGITDRQCRLCFALCMWNGRDPILKERLFGLTGPEGNHGEDCKENYYYLDSTPTHSYMKGLYKYPYEYPYARLVEENSRRNKSHPEYELDDTGVFDERKYFDVFAEYAKASENDILIKVTVANRGSRGRGVSPAADAVVPQLLVVGLHVRGLRAESPACTRRSRGRCTSSTTPFCPTTTTCRTARARRAERLRAVPVLRRARRGRGRAGAAVHGQRDEPQARLRRRGEPDEVREGRVPRLRDPRQQGRREPQGVRHEGGGLVPADRAAGGAGRRAPALGRSEVERRAAVRRGVRRDVLAAQGRVRRVLRREDPQHAERPAAARRPAGVRGMLWSKQFYHYVVDSWLKGDPWQPPPPEGHTKHGRNREWAQHLFNRDIISMPDKWEYPWYAAWDLAFHCIPFARIDPHFAKEQLILMLREWYMHPNGQLPAYEFCFGDVNPPVHAWAVWRVYKMTAPRASATGCSSPARSRSC
jgi:hypothetical protein